MSQTVHLGSTGIEVNKNGFGALPIQRVEPATCRLLLLHAYEQGIRFFDTAASYTDSETKLGNSLHEVREELVIATKTPAQNASDFWRDLHRSLVALQTTYIDIYQFHNPGFCPKPGDGTGLYEAALQAKEQGLILHIGISNHSLAVAQEAVESGLYETLQFPFSYLASDSELALVKSCEEHNMGFIAMKALAGGLITDAVAAYAFMSQFPHVIPIWGIQRESELMEFIQAQHENNGMTEQIAARIKSEQAALFGDFCRGCGYCEPCPVGIEIHNCARMSLMIRRAPVAQQLTKESQEKMARIADCLHCGSCKSKCPYHLDTPTLLRKNYEDYQEILNGKQILSRKMER